MNTPTVSIVIPAYNHADFLKQAIESVLGQNYPQIELIVLDDGSTDSTREILAEYSGKFFWETQQNMGQARTLNKGWAMSKGAYLSYLAADDYLHPGAVKAAVEKLVANPQVVLTYCDFNMVNSHSQILRRKRTPDFSYTDLAVRLICQPGPGVFFCRDAFERAGFWDESLRRIPDFEYWLRLGLEGPFERIPKALASYRMHDQSQSFGPIAVDRAEEMVNVISTHFQNVRLPPEIAHAKPEAMSNAHLVSARMHLNSGRYLIALKHALYAFNNYPYIYFRPRTWRIFASGLFDRIGYNSVGWFRRIFAGK